MSTLISALGWYLIIGGCTAAIDLPVMWRDATADREAGEPWPVWRFPLRSLFVSLSWPLAIAVAVYDG
jgi:hypothetical protein